MRLTGVSSTSIQQAQGANGHDPSATYFLLPQLIHQIQSLEARILPEQGRVRKFGLSHLKEHDYLLTKQARNKDV